MQAFSPAAADQASGGLNRGLVTASIMLATIMQVLDSTIANVALPHMQASLGAAQDTVTWVLTSYIVASAIATPLTGWLADRIGLKQLLLAAIGGFIGASMLCGAATNLTQMVLFRVAQGVFGAFLVPLAQTIMLGIYPKEKHGQAMALWGMGVMVGPIMGPVLGGWLTENFDWRWVFYVNLPIGLLALAGVWASLPRSTRVERRFDMLGFALLALAVGAFQLMLDRGEQLDWFASWEIWIEGTIALAGLWMFGVHVATARDPLLPISLFRDRNLLTALIFSFVTGVLLLAGMALLPPMLQRLFGYPVITTGMMLAPRGIGTMASMMIVGQLVGRVDPRLLIFTGLTLMAVSLYQMTGFSLDMDTRPVIVSGLIQGLGLGLIFVPLNTIAFATLAPRLRTDASGLFTLIRSIGSSVGISLVTTLLVRNSQIGHADLAAQVTPFSLPQIDPSMAQAIGSAGDTLLSMLDTEVNRQALMIAYVDDFQFMMIMTLLVMPLVLVLRRPRSAAQPEQVSHAVID